MVALLVAGCGSGTAGQAAPATTLPPALEVGALDGVDVEAVLAEAASAAEWPHIAYTIEVLPTLELDLVCRDELVMLAIRGDDDSVVVLATGSLGGAPIEAYWLTSGMYLLAPEQSCARR